LSCMRMRGGVPSVSDPEGGTLRIGRCGGTKPRGWGDLVVVGEVVPGGIDLARGASKRTPIWGEGCCGRIL